MTLEDRQQLDEFVGEVYDLLRLVVIEQRSQLLPEDLWQSYDVAFRDIEAFVGRTRVALLPEVMQVAPTDDPYVRELDARLGQAGLTGAQLQLKRRGWRRAFTRFRRSPGRSLARAAFRWANVILGSLAGVIGAAEALKEFKEAVEAGLEDEG